MSGLTQTMAINNKIEIFQYLLIEDFFIKKNMTSTLTAFREEWSRPTETETLLSWYDVAIKLKLQDITKDQENNTILYNIINEMIKESSIKTRRKPEVITSGLVELKQTSSLPNIATTNNETIDSNDNSFDFTSNDAFQIDNINTNTLSNTNTFSNTNTNSYDDTENNFNDSKNRTSIRSKQSRAIRYNQPRVSTPNDSPALRRLLNMNIERYNKNKYLSKEHWIPESIRMNSIKRNMLVVRDNVDTIKILDTYQTRELKSHKMTDIDRINSEKFPGQVVEMPCACCMQVYLIENLPKTISQKAILDIRLMWSGGLTSETIFGSINDTINESRNTWSILRKDELLKTIPRCYDEVKICLFCSQFFQDQTNYRPSLNNIIYNEKLKIKNDILLKEKEYWDPLKMIEKDREEQELLLQTINSNNSFDQTNYNNNTNYQTNELISTSFITTQIP